jgi:thioredoxin reductase (NADPH)
VYLIHRRDTFRASKIMIDRTMKNPKIEFVLNSVVEDVIGENEVKSLKLRNIETDEVNDLFVQGLFVAIGHKPNTDLFKGVLEMNDVGYLKTKPGTTYTSVEGVFAAGDVQDHVYRQAVTAAGTGCMAAIDCERWLESQEIR